MDLAEREPEPIRFALRVAEDVEALGERQRLPAHRHRAYAAKGELDVVALREREGARPREIRVRAPEREVEFDERLRHALSAEVREPLVDLRHALVREEPFALHPRRG